MSPGRLIAIGCWATFMAWLIYEVFTAPFVPEPESLWLARIEPSSVQDLEDCVADDFARDLEQLRSMRFYSISDWTSR